MIPSGLATSEYSKYFEPPPDAMFEDVYFADNTLFEGKRYGISTGVNTQGIVYNKKAFDTAGVDKVPTTLDELYGRGEAESGGHHSAVHELRGSMDDGQLGG